MVDFDPIEVKDLRESAPHIKLSKSSMRNKMGNSRSRISEKRGLASLIAGASGSNFDVDKQFDDLVCAFETKPAQQPSTSAATFDQVY